MGVNYKVFKNVIFYNMEERAPMLTTSKTDTENKANTSDTAANHLYCCQENVSLCGQDISELDTDLTTKNDENICIVCEELDMSETFICPACLN